MSLEVKSQVSGIVIVLDMKDLGFNHIMNVTSEHVKSIANVIQVTEVFISRSSCVSYITIFAGNLSSSLSRNPHNQRVVFVRFLICPHKTLFVRNNQEQGEL